MPEQRASYVYHLHEGVVGYIKAFADGREVVTKLMIPPMLIGFAGFAGMDSRRHIGHVAEARAITSVVYCRTKREAIWDLMDDRQARAQIMDMICGTSLLISRVEISCISTDIESRILAILGVLGQSVSTRDTGERIVIDRISHDDIAVIAQVTRPTVSRALEKLQRQGVIELSRRRIVLLMPEKLKANTYS